MRSATSEANRVLGRETSVASAINEYFTLALYVADPWKTSKHPWGSENVVIAQLSPVVEVFTVDRGVNTPTCPSAGYLSSTLTDSGTIFDHPTLGLAVGGRVSNFHRTGTGSKPGDPANHYIDDRAKGKAALELANDLLHGVWRYGGGESIGECVPFTKSRLILVWKCTLKCWRWKFGVGF